MNTEITYPMPQTKHTKKLLKKIRTEAEALYSEELKALPYGLFQQFLDTGRRLEYEEKYMEHRKALLVYFAMALTGEDDKWTKKLCDVVWAVCDEFSWAIPAHLKDRDYADCVTRIDLFASETAFALAEIYGVLGDRLPRHVSQRIEYELDRRIITPFLNNPHSDKNPVMRHKNNWAAVCACGILAPLYYLNRKDEFDKVRELLSEVLTHFAEGYGEDGYCSEGSLYWSYGFSHFCYAADFFRKLTDGEVDFFKQDKVRKMAMFGPNCYLKGDAVIPFADSGHHLGYDSGLWSFLHEEYPEFPIPDTAYENEYGDDVRYRIGTFIRNLYWETEENTPAKPETLVFYPSAGLYVNRKFDYVFGAKGGTNGEHHNHNDIGSFFLYDDGKFIIDDPGWPEYFSDYFGPGRYQNMCASSLGHSVPIVEGAEQSPGAEFCAKEVQYSETEFSCDIAGAYAENPDYALKRAFSMEAGQITLTETLSGTPRAVTERFMTTVKPEIEGGTVRIGNWILTCGREAVPAVSTFEYTPRFTEFTHGPDYRETAYLIDFTFEKFDKVIFTLRRWQIC